MSPSLAGINVVIAAAGIGQRFGADKPKQYVEVAGKNILAHTLSVFSDLKPDRLVLVVAANDKYYPSLGMVNHCEVVIGGELRCDSVLNGINHLEPDEQDWIMVHDAARPCVRPADIAALCEQVASDGVGGLLGVPVNSTVKQVSGSEVVKTLDRTDLWLAQTPQLFRAGILRRALINAHGMTDEASAVEALGLQPKMVAGHEDNIKITRTEDLPLAEFLLSKEGNH